MWRLIPHLVLYVAGIYLFSSGFLLSRHELENKQECSYVSVLEKESYFASKTPSKQCHQGLFRRAILVMLDALRFDFVVPLNQSHPDSNLHYRNKLPIFDRLLKTQPAHSLLLRSKADPPTTTMQRLKALSTGTLPTFVDAGSNFGALAIKEDNLFAQLKQHGFRSHFMGDDTWMSLFPTSFNSSFPYPSFDVWDLHTVDEGVVRHLFPFIKDKTWDILVGHFLGIDHAGHRYGPEHPEMAAKLTQVNHWLEQLVEQADQDTVIIIMGDHGMDPKGDHGGDTKLEMDTTTFMYSKKAFLSQDPILLQQWSKTLEQFHHRLPQDHSFVTFEGYRSIPQIDFVSTFALMMGIPIPFGNLGSVIPEVFLGLHGENQVFPLQGLLDSARLNAHQIHQYISKYCETSTDLSIDDLTQLYRQAETAYRDFIPLTKTKKTSELFQGALDVYFKYVLFMRTTLLSAREIWAKFNDVLMALGLIIMLLGSLSLLVPTIDTRKSLLAVVPPTILAILAFVMIETLSGGDVLKISARNWAVFIFSCIYAILLIVLGARNVEKWQGFAKWVKPIKDHPSNTLGFVLFLLHLLVPAASSYTYWEEWVTHYLLQTYGMYELYRALTQRKAIFFRWGLLFMILNRISSASTICREQGPECTPTFNASSTMSVAALWTIPVYCIVQGIVWASCRYFLKKHQSCYGMGSVMSQVVLPINLVCCAIYWGLDTCEGHGLLAHNLHFLTELKLWVAKTGIASSVICSFYLWFTNPFCFGINVLDQDSDDEVESPHPDRLSDKPKTKVQLIGIQHGLGSSVFCLMMALYMLLLATQKPMGGIMLGLGFLKIQCLVFLWEFQHPGSHYLQPLVLYLLAIKIFFSTGHQTMFSTIQWEVGFIGIKKVNWFLSPLFVFCNTFGGHILATMALVLYSVWIKKDVSSKQTRQLTLVPMTWVLDMMKRLVLIVFVCVGVNAALAAHFKRHLLVWAIFAPRFIFSTLWGGVCIGCAIIGYGVYIYCADQLNHFKLSPMLKKNK